MVALVWSNVTLFTATVALAASFSTLSSFCSSEGLSLSPSHMGEFCISAEISPFIRLPLMDSVRRLPRLPSSSGSVPVMRLLLRSSTRRLESAGVTSSASSASSASTTSTSPSSAMAASWARAASNSASSEASERVTASASLPKAAGILPPIRLSLRMILWILSSFTRSSGSWPVRLLPGNSIAVT